MNASRYQKISDLAESQAKLIEEMVKINKDQGIEVGAKVNLLLIQSSKLTKLLTFTERE